MKKNNYNLFMETNKAYSSCKTFSLLSSFIVWISLGILMLFPLFGFGLAFFAMCFLCIGFKKNILDCLQNKPTKIEYVFNYYENCLSAFCLKVSSIIITLLWSLLLIVPGIIVGLNYSFISYIFSENTDIGTMECLNKSRDMVYGYRSEIFLIYLIEFLFICLVALFFSSLVIMLNYLVVLPIWANILIVFGLTAFVFLVFVFPYFEMMLANIYIRAKKEQIKNTKKLNKTISKQ